MNKSFLKDFLMSIPIFLFYILFIKKLSESLTTSLVVEERNRKTLVISFVSAIIGIILALYVFNRDNQFENRSIKYALIIGSIYLMVNSLLFNWDNIQSDSKLFMIGIVLAILIISSYFI